MNAWVALVSSECSCGFLVSQFYGVGVVAGFDVWRCGPMNWSVNPLGGSADGVPRLPLKGLTCALRG